MSKLFHERSIIGHYSGNVRDFDEEYASVEPDDDPNEAQEWMLKAEDPTIQKNGNQNGFPIILPK